MTQQYSLEAVWSRLGIAWSVPPELTPLTVDVERAIVDAADVFSYDSGHQSLFVAWLSRFGAAVDAQRVLKLAIENKLSKRAAAFLCGASRHAEELDGRADWAILANALGKIHGLASSRVLNPDEYDLAIMMRGLDCKFAEFGLRFPNIDEGDRRKLRSSAGMSCDK